MLLLYLELAQGDVVVVEGSQEQDVLARDNVVRREAADLWWQHIHPRRAKGGSRAGAGAGAGAGGIQGTAGALRQQPHPQSAAVVWSRSHHEGQQPKRGRAWSGTTYLSRRSPKSTRMDTHRPWIPTDRGIGSRPGDTQMVCSPTQQPRVVHVLRNAVAEVASTVCSGMGGE